MSVPKSLEESNLLNQKILCLSRVTLAYEYLIMAQDQLAKEKEELEKVEKLLKEVNNSKELSEWETKE